MEGPGPGISYVNPKSLKVTLPKFNIAPEKWWLEDYFPIRKVTF